MKGTLLKSILHNVFVTVVSFGIGLLGVSFDFLLHIPPFQSPYSIVGGIVLLFIGFVIRVWATNLFYAKKMKVIVLKPQSELITDGPYKFSRNPLYLGGNVCMFFGASLILGSVSAILITLIGIFVTDSMIRREERQLAARFGEQWEQYKKQTRRWI